MWYLLKSYHSDYTKRPDNLPSYTSCWKLSCMLIECAVLKHNGGNLCHAFWWIEYLCIDTNKASPCRIEYLCRDINKASPCRIEYLCIDTNKASSCRIEYLCIDINKASPRRIEYLCIDINKASPCRIEYLCIDINKVPVERVVSTSRRSRHNLYCPVFIS